MATPKVVFPGEPLSPHDFPNPPNTTQPLKLGPGLRQTSSGITPTVAGILTVDHKRNAIWVENHTGRYIPQVNDFVIAQVHHSASETFLCSITPHTPFAHLPHLAFEGVSKKTRPQLATNSLVYARISSVTKHTDPELVCYNLSTGKSEGMGELKGGMLFDISLGMARRLLMAKQEEEGGLSVLDDIAAANISFEIAVGQNGRLWVNADGVRTVLLVGKAVQETDKGRLDVDEQKKLVKRLLRSLS